MNLITKFALFESINRIFFTQEQIDLVNNILERKDEIKEEYELVIIHRQPFTTDDYLQVNPGYHKIGCRYIDIRKIITGVDNSVITSEVAVYDVIKKEFVLFYKSGKRIHLRENFIKIKSEDFFDQIEKVYYEIYLDVE